MGRIKRTKKKLSHTLDWDINNSIFIVHGYNRCYAECTVCTSNNYLWAFIAIHFIIHMFSLDRNWDVWFQWKKHKCSVLQRNVLLWYIFFKQNPEMGTSLNVLMVSKIFFVPPCKTYSGNNMQELLIGSFASFPIIHDKMRFWEQIKNFLFSFVTNSS